MTQGDRLKQARIRAGFKSAAAAARRYSWNKNTYTSNENGNRKLSREAAEEYAQKFRVTLDWLLTGKGNIAARVLLIASKVGAGAEVIPFDEGSSLGEIDPPPSSPPGAFAVLIDGDSQLPKFEPGDVLVCTLEADPQALLYKWAIVDVAESGKRYLKKLQPSSKRGAFTLFSLNAAEMRDVRIERAYRILWHKTA
jgi:phage repressor protein C with HTH and peptisase S24 domain